MLSELTIRNFAIIDDLQLTLDEGMTVLSGETGAGKSILVDALGLLLGERADSDSVRDGEKRAEIIALFRIDDSPRAQAWLRERELDALDDDEPDQCILRRVVSREGRSRNWINGAPANARDLAALGEFLVDIHGQHAHQSLLKPAIQRDLLDDYGAHGPLRKRVADSHTKLGALVGEIDALEQRDSDGHSRLELLRYQVQELQALNLQPGELAKLEAEHKRMANAEHLVSTGQATLDLLYETEDNAAVSLLGTAEKSLGDLAAIDPDFDAAAELAASARIQTQEAADELRRVLDRLDIDPARLSELDNRLGEIQDVARKHHCAAEALPELADRLAQELSDLENAGERLAELRRELDHERALYQTAAGELSNAREKAGATLAAAVTDIIHNLGMPEGRFLVDTNHDAQAAPSAHGLDRIVFRVGANPGQSPRPIERVASGGELSRISLAIQAVAVGNTSVPTLVFDEVDAGIGGGVAEIVGRLLRGLGENRQALCVTHLPQVAAQARQHLRVAKTVTGGRTRTHITALDDDERVQELARMLGGVDITDQTRAHASEMLGRQ